LALWVLFNDRNVRFKQYSLFKEQDDETGGDGFEEDTDRGSVAQHYGWWWTLYHLSKTNILSITGDEALTDINFITVLNYLQIEKDSKDEEMEAERRMMQQVRR
jgi:hypothetical protein